MFPDLAPGHLANLGLRGAQSDTPNSLPVRPLLSALRSLSGRWVAGVQQVIARSCGRYDEVQGSVLIRNRGHQEADTSPAGGVRIARRTRVNAPTRSPCSPMHARVYTTAPATT